MALRDGDVALDRGVELRHRVEHLLLRVAGAGLALALGVGVEGLRGGAELVHPPLRVGGALLLPLRALRGPARAVARVPLPVLGGAAVVLGAVALGARLVHAPLRVAALALGGRGAFLRLLRPLSGLLRLRALLGGGAVPLVAAAGGLLCLVLRALLALARLALLALCLGLALLGLPLGLRVAARLRGGAFVLGLLSALPGGVLLALRLLLA